MSARSVRADAQPSKAKRPRLTKAGWVYGTEGHTFESCRARSESQLENEPTALISCQPVDGSAHSVSFASVTAKRSRACRSRKMSRPRSGLVPADGRAGDRCDERQEIFGCVEAQPRSGQRATGCHANPMVLGLAGPVAVYPRAVDAEADRHADREHGLLEVGRSAPRDGGILRGWASAEARSAATADRLGSLAGDPIESTHSTAWAGGPAPVTSNLR